MTILNQMETKIIVSGAVEPIRELLEAQPGPVFGRMEWKVIAQ